MQFVTHSPLALWQRAVLLKLLSESPCVPCHVKRAAEKKKQSARCPTEQPRAGHGVGCVKNLTPGSWAARNWYV